MPQGEAEFVVRPADAIALGVGADQVDQAGAQAEQVAAEGDAVAGVAQVRLDRLDPDRLHRRQRQARHTHDRVDPYSTDHQHIQLHPSRIPDFGQG